MDMQIWLTFVAATMVSLMIPGPTTILVLTYALTYALLADGLRGTIRKPVVLGWMTRVGGAVLIAMGVATATLRKAA